MIKKQHEDRSASVQLCARSNTFLYSDQNGSTVKNSTYFILSVSGALFGNCWTILIKDWNADLLAKWYMKQQAELGVIAT